MYDVIEKIGKTIIQHGKYNNRIYLMKFHIDDYPDILKILEQLALEKSYTKIFAKVPSWLVEGFGSEGYVMEAEIPEFYNGQKKACFVSKFLDNMRAVQKESDQESIVKNLELAFEKKGKSISISQNPSFNLKELKNEDLGKLSKLYSKVFKSYPFPIFEKKYLKKTLNDNVVYFGIFENKKLIAASSAEIDTIAVNAEMTDFATDPEYAGNNLSLILLRTMEQDMIARGIKKVYTIARSFSAGMNITFAKQGYEYSGTLVNNTNISGNIESMNIWHKSIL
jgi:putative beta-lysine N-acetyltransferase